MVRNQLPHPVIKNNLSKHFVFYKGNSMEDYISLKILYLLFLKIIAPLPPPLISCGWIPNIYMAHGSSKHFFIIKLNNVKWIFL